MEGASELLIRNRARLPQRVLLVNPPTDGIVQTLAADCELSSWTQDYRNHQKIGSRSSFSAVYDKPIPADSLVVIFVPKAKERLELLLSMLASKAEAGAAIWLVGGKQQGAASSAKRMAKIIGPVTKLDAARHAMLFESIVESQTDEFGLDSLAVQVSENPALISLPGVFSHGRVDDGTALLLEHLGEIPDTMLDFGCGCGVLSVHAAKANPNVQITALDSDALAVEATKRTFAAHGMSSANVIASDGLSEFEGRVDLILTNPPFHQSHATDHGVTDELIRNATKHLTSGGRLRIVANQFLPYPAIMNSVFGNCETVVETGRYRILESIWRPGQQRAAKRRKR